MEQAPWELVVITRFDWKDIWFTALIEPSDAHLDFRLYSIKALYDDGPLGYETAGGDFGAGDQTEKLEDAQVYASGSIKWDGCANVRFDEQDQVMLHFCGRHSWRDLAEAFERLYDTALIMFPQQPELIGQR